MVTPSANAGAAKQKVSSFVPAANLLDDSAGSLSYGIPKEALNVLPNLIQWIETNNAITDFGISHTTLEEVFIALARPTTEATIATATTVVVDKSAVAIVEGKTTDPTTTVTVATATATATATAIPTGEASAASDLSEEENKILNYKRIPTTTKQKMKALCYQRTIARQRHQKYNVCLCLCPAIAMLILFGLCFAFDQILVSMDKQAKLTFETQKKNCNSCQEAGVKACTACHASGPLSFTPVDTPQKWEQHQPRNRYIFDGDLQCTPATSTIMYEECGEYEGSSCEKRTLNSNGNPYASCRFCDFCDQAKAEMKKTGAWDYNMNTSFNLYDINGQNVQFDGCEQLQTMVCEDTAVQTICQGDDAKVSCALSNPGMEYINDNVFCQQSCSAYYKAITTALGTEVPFTIPDTKGVVNNFVKPKDYIDRYSSTPSKFCAMLIRSSVA